MFIHIYNTNKKCHLGICDKFKNILLKSFWMKIIYCWKWKMKIFDFFFGFCSCHFYTVEKNNVKIYSDSFMKKQYSLKILMLLKLHHLQTFGCLFKSSFYIYCTITVVWELSSLLIWIIISNMRIIRLIKIKSKNVYVLLVFFLNFS